MDLVFEKDKNYYTIVWVMPHKNKIKGTLIYDGGAHASPSTVTTNSALSAKGNDKGGVTNEAIAHEKINVPSTSNVAQGQEEVNGVDNAKLVPYRDAVARIMSQAGRDKSYLSKAENALVDIIKDANHASVEDVLNNVVYVEKHPDVDHGTDTSYIELFAANKDGKKIFRFRILAKEGVKSSGRYVVREARFYDIIKEKNLPTHASKDAHIVASSPNRSLSADTQQNKFFNTISVAELLQGVNDRINDKPYVNPDGLLNYDAKLMGKKKKRKKYSLQPKEDVEEESLKDVAHPQDIVDAINDSVPIYEKSKLSPNATGDKLYNEHSGTGFSGSYLSQYGRILAMHLDKVIELKNNKELT